MRIEKRNDGWWIVGVAPYRVDGVLHDACGPYPTKVAAQEDREGLESFFDEHPEYTESPPLLEVGEVQQRQYTAHWFVKSLAFRPQKLTRPRKLKSAPGQRLLPGMDAE